MNLNRVQMKMYVSIPFSTQVLYPQALRARVCGVCALGGFPTDSMPGYVHPECQSDGSGCLS